MSGIHIRNQLGFEGSNPVFQLQLALFQPRQLKLVDSGVLGETRNGLVEVAVLLAQLRDQVCDFRRIFLEIGHD
mgnify:CR=1 FL=1